VKTCIHRKIIVNDFLWEWFGGITYLMAGRKNIFIGEVSIVGGVSKFL
jgi:hypothetical protein